MGIISLVLLAIAIPARYLFHLAGAWRSTYVVCAVMSLYLNCFVLVAQAFLKAPALHALAPKGKEPPFLVTQLALLALFMVLTILAVKRSKTPAQPLILFGVRSHNWRMLTSGSSTGLQFRAP